MPVVCLVVKLLTAEMTKDLEGRVCGQINTLYKHMPGRFEGNHVKPPSV
jgi:hypothetical protein